MSPGPRRDPPLDAEERKRIVEAILFAHDGPVTIEMLAESLAAEDPATIRQAIAELGRDYDSNGLSFEIVRIAGGYQICTRERWANWVARFRRGSRRVRLSRAAVETLAIVAYRQPITRTQIEEVRGVDCGGVLHTLLERTLITVKGRSRGIGRPLLYASTSEFLEYFGLDRLEDLPRLDEIESLLKDREEVVEEVIGTEGEGLAVAVPEDADPDGGEETAAPEVSGQGEGLPGESVLAGVEFSDDAEDPNATGIGGDTIDAIDDDEIEEIYTDEFESVESGRTDGVEGYQIVDSDQLDRPQLDGDEVEDWGEPDDDLGDVERAAVLATEADPEDDSDDDSGERV